jgi:hypothetical protein
MVEDVRVVLVERIVRRSVAFSDCFTNNGS